MTSDHKVGLLLGLALIVIIAFLMNGLPGLLSGNPSSDLIRTTAIGTSATLRLDGQASDAVRRVRRERIDLPYPPRRINLEENRRKDPRFAVGRVTGITRVTKNKTSGTPLKVYTVEDGDNLATIARKVYGSEIGNKHATIAKLFEANRDLLVSADDISIGQKLRIPYSLTAKEVKARDKLKLTGVFDKVKNTFNNMVNRPSTQSRARTYIVKDGDSLWKIAEKMLSDGSRFGEIRNFNRNILPDEDSLTIGMRLQIPQK